MTEYSDRLARELENFVELEELNKLPASHALWEENCLRPLFEELGITDLPGFWDDTVTAQCVARAPENVRLVSIGAGLGDFELALAERLAARGHTNLELVLLELNPDLCRHAADEADRLGMADRVTTVETDLNTWVADGRVDVYFANHSLHHIVELERLFAEIKRTLRPGGVLLVNDMIGRNGHVRWPEAADLIERIWRVTPSKYRWNHPYGRLDETYADIDCAEGSFEGVRAEEVLPLLLKSFHPDVFIAFGSVIDPFIDRVYGFNFDANDPSDAAFIAAVGKLDDAAVDLGLVTPTHMIASFRNGPVPVRYPRDRSPERMVREPEATAEPVVFDADPDARLAELQARADDGWRRYEELRNRRAVRLALRVAQLRNTLRRSS